MEFQLCQAAKTSVAAQSSGKSGALRIAAQSYKKCGIFLESRSEINSKGWEAVLELGRQAEAAGVQDMSLDEINAVIKEVRDAR